MSAPADQISPYDLAELERIADRFREQARQLRDCAEELFHYAALVGHTPLADFGAVAGQTLANLIEEDFPTTRGDN